MLQLFTREIDNMGDKLTFKNQQIFGYTGIGPTGIVGQFGSYKAGIPNYSYDTDVIQALGAWGEGVNGSGIDSSPPALQDMNAAFYVITEYLNYIYQNGIPSKLNTIYYYLGSIVNDALGIFASVADSGNINKYLEFDDSYWQMQMSKNNFAYYEPTLEIGTVSIYMYDLYSEIVLPQTTESFVSLSVYIPQSVTGNIGQRHYVQLRPSQDKTIFVTYVSDYGTINGSPWLAKTVTGTTGMSGNQYNVCFISKGSGWISFNENF